MKNIFTTTPKWDNEQLLVLNSKPNIIIEGGAGSGKTLLAIYLAKELEDRGEKNISIIVFTMALRTFIEHTLDDLGLSEVKVFYNEQLSSTLIAKHDYIIIDEAQDFSVRDIMAFKSRANKGIFIFADDNQRLYEKTLKNEPTLEIPELIQETNFPVIKLKNNYRISNSIVNLISDLYPNSHLEGSNYNSGLKPTFVKCNNPIQELEFIRDYCIKNPSEDIGILLKQNDASGDCTYMFNRNNRRIILPGILETRDFLLNSGIQIGYKYKSNDNLVFNKGFNINVMTFHSSKGIEFDTVILPFSHLMNSHSNTCITYVGMTRSKSNLIITYSDLISDEFVGNISNVKYEGIIRFFEGSKDFP